MGLFDTVEVKGLQVLFRDNRHVKFRTIPVRHTCLCEIHPNDKNIVVRGWKDYYKNHYSFRGYKGIPAGEATLSFERDIVLNLNNIIPKEQLPRQGGDLKQHVDIGVNRFRQLAAKKESTTVADKMTTVLLITFGLSFVGLLLTFAKTVMAK